MGHSSVTTTLIYAHLSPDCPEHFRAALSGVGGQQFLSLRVVR